MVVYRRYFKSHIVALNWNPPVPVTGITVISYNVYRSTTRGGPYVKIASSLHGPRYSDSLVNHGRTYFYVVTSVDKRGRESRYSGEVRAEIP